jgi:hypothetical protein
MIRGERPSVDELVAWEYRGANLPATSRLLGLRRFVKGFVSDGHGGVGGYNKSVRGSSLASPWEVRPQRDGRVAWAWFSVGPVDPEAVDRAYLRALLLDYGAVEEPEAGIAGRLRDYVVRVVPGEDELLLGQAFLAVGSRRVAVGWFALERLGRSEERCLGSEVEAR